MNTAFLLTHVPNPRINKRLRIANDMGDISIICIRRSSQNVYEPVFKDVPYHILKMDLPVSEKLLRRTLFSLRFFLYAFRNLSKERPDIMYTVSLDTLLIAAFYRFFHRRTRIVLEIADVRETFLKGDGGIRRKLISGLEKRLYPKVQLLVLTSEQFYHHYYNRYFPIEKVAVVPNVPDLSAFRDYKRKQSGPFTVGFIGGIRYLDQMKMLVDAAEVTGVRVLFAGAGGTTNDMEAITSYCQGKSHVDFTGKYHYDQDIARLYGMVDCVYAVYDADNPNVRIALPNKLYEAAYCGLPIIVARGTYLAEVVERNGLGYVVDHREETELVELFKKLNTEETEDNERAKRAGQVFLAGLPIQDLGKRLLSLTRISAESLADTESEERL